MGYSNRKMKKSHSIYSNIIIGGAIGIGVTLALCFLSAFLIWKTYLPETYSAYCAMGTIMLASYGGCLAGAIGDRESRWLICAVVGSMYFVLLLLAGVILCAGSLRGAVVTAAMVLCGTVLAGLTGWKGKGRKRHF